MSHDFDDGQIHFAPFSQPVASEKQLTIKHYIESIIQLM